MSLPECALEQLVWWSGESELAWETVLEREEMPRFLPVGAFAQWEGPG